MARYTSEQAAQQIGNLYDLVLVASVRTKMLNIGDKRLVSKPGSNTVTALREIEAGLIGREMLEYYRIKESMQREYLGIEE